MPKRIMWGNKLKLIFPLTVTFAAIAFAYSFVGFISPHEEIRHAPSFDSGFTVEYGGHFLFGVIAGLPYWDPMLIALVAALAIAIDADHLLSLELQFPINGRPAHSILFIVLSTTLLLFLAKRLGAKNCLLVKTAFAAPIAILSHIAFDVFSARELSAGGSDFPLFIPLSFSMIDFPRYAWLLLEAAAFAAALLVRLGSEAIIGQDDAE